jgi:hypothetical protein
MFCRLIADVYRQDSAGEAADMVRDVLEHRRDEVIGLGMVGDPDVVGRVLADGIVFTTCPTATAVCYFSDDLTEQDGEGGTADHAQLR